MFILYIQLISIDILPQTPFVLFIWYIQYTLHITYIEHIAQQFLVFVQTGPKNKPKKKIYPVSIGSCVWKQLINDRDKRLMKEKKGFKLTGRLQEHK